MIRIPFVKASACGNDFLIIDGMHAPADLILFTRRICDRHNGVGADGVEWLFPAQDADIRARLLNADGSEAEIFHLLESFGYSCDVIDRQANSLYTIIARASSPD